MALLSPSPDLDQQTQEAMRGVLMRPGRGKRASQWVAGGGEFSGLTQNEIYGRLRARQGGNSGSGPGGGLRTGGLSQGSGIDWLKENGPSRYGQTGLKRAEHNVAMTGNAGIMSNDEQDRTDKITEDIAKAAAAKAAAVPPTAPAAPAMPDILDTSLVQAPKPAISPMIARPAEPAAPAKPAGLAPPSAPNYQAPPVSAAPAPSAPPVLAKPQVATAAAPAPAPVNPDPLAPASANPYPARSFTPSPNPVLDRAKTELAKPRDLSADANPAAFAEWQKTDPDAIANRDKESSMIGRQNDLLGGIDATKRSTVANMRGNNADLMPGYAVGSDAREQQEKWWADSKAWNKDTSNSMEQTIGLPLQKDERSKKSPLTAPSNPLDPVKVSQNPRTRGIPALGSSPAPTPPVLQKPVKPNNQTVVGNIANKRQKNPLSDMLKGLV